MCSLKEKKSEKHPFLILPDTVEFPKIRSLEVSQGHGILNKILSPLEQLKQ